MVEMIAATCSSASPPASAARQRMAEHPQATKGVQRVAYAASMAAFFLPFKRGSSESSPLVSIIIRRWEK
eukprot:9501898-Pyramimonas_sp.AAC.1